MLLPDLFLPVTRLMPRGAGRAINLLGGRDDEAWRASSWRFRTFRDRSLDATVRVDLAEWYGRLHYYAGRYYDLDIPHVIRTRLGAGDTFIDIGAHYGMHSLCASQVVGANGRVISFEPNPRTFEILQNHISINHRRNVTLHNAGVADLPGSLTLAWNDTAMASFLPDAEAKNAVSVPVVRGDDVLTNENLPGSLLIKIDAEGFEHRILRGLSSTLNRPDVSLVIEITDEWLRRDGSSAKELVDDLQSRGFIPQSLHTSMSFRGTRVAITPIEKLPTDWQYDLLFERR